MASPRLRVLGNLEQPALALGVAALPLALTLVVGEATRGSLWTLAAAVVATVAAAGTAWWLAASRSRALVAARRAARAVRACEQRAKALTDNMLEALVVVDARARICAVNPAAARMFGYAESEMIGQHLALLLPEDAAVDAEGYLREARRKALGLVTEWDGRHRSGARVSFELSMFTFESHGGLLFAGLLRDVGERQRVERRRREFLANVTHELRTPLTSIRGALGLLRSGALGELPEDAADVLAIADRNTVRLASLVNDLLDLERLGSGEMDLHLQAVEPARVVERALEVAGAMAAQHGVVLRRTVPEPCPEVQGDEPRLVQVLVNLVSNAVKFSPRGGVVEVSVLRAGHAVEFRVDDRGRGVPAAHRESIFERFRQVEAGDAREKGGTGLGLAISKAIVARHSGLIGVTDAPAGGSRFWFQVPTRAAASDPVAASLRGGLAEGDAPCVLLVDDDEDHLGLLGRQMIRAGFAVQTAMSVAEAVEAGRRRTPALVVLDLKLRDGSGYDVVRAFRGDPALRQMPLIVYTVDDVGPAQQQWLRLGPSRVLTKTRTTNEQLMQTALELAASAPRGREAA